MQQLLSLKKNFMPFDAQKFKQPSEFYSMQDRFTFSQSYGHNIRELIFMGYQYPGQRYEIPAFQRPLVWTDTQKQGLIRSILSGLPIGTLLIAIDAHTVFYPIDGQQRINTIREFVLDKFKIETPSGIMKSWSQLEWKDKYYFLDFPLVTNSILNVDYKTQAELYVLLNSKGTPHSDAEIKLAMDASQTWS